MPKIQAITNEMKAIAGRIGDNVSTMQGSQANVRSCMQTILINFESTPRVLTALHLANVTNGYRNSGESLNGYRDFLVNAADTYEWNDEQLARWKNTSIGDKINNEPDTSTGSETNSEITYQNYDNPKEFMRDFLREKIGNDYGVAGLMGNLYAESGLKANNLQDPENGGRVYNMSDDDYTIAVDSGSYDNFINDGTGYGIAQWTASSRKQGLLEFAKEKGTSIGDLQTQLEFLWKELSEEFTDVLNTLKNASSIREASDAVLKGFEKPLYQTEYVCITRAQYGENLYSELMA